MSFPAATKLELLVLITWACLSIPVWKNGVFTQLLFSEAVSSEICCAASLSFAPGLFDAMQAASPPAVEFFRNLPSDRHRRWAVYALTLEKPGAVPLIYIGSGTDSSRGVHSRWQIYDQLKSGTMPQYIAAALEDGYKITHKGLLIWSPIPSAADVPRFRLLFVAMEAAMSFSFWAKKSRKPDHCMISCSLWPLSSFSYTGLCSHNPLAEGVHANLDLSAEQLETIAAEIKEKNRIYQANYHRTQRALEPERVKERQNRAAVRFKKNSPDKIKEKQERFSAEWKASKKYYCTICKVPCSKKFDLERHNRSKRHLSNVAKADLGVVKKYRCDLCPYSCAKSSHMEIHNRGERHLQRVAAAESSSRSTADANTVTRTFTTVADNQQTVQFPVYQGERVNCEDNTSLGEFTLAPIPPMKAGEPVLEVVFEVDVNGILKVTATEKTSGRTSNITISNSVGKLSSTEIEKMIDGNSH
jgi:hypothetical protein